MRYPPHTALMMTILSPSFIVAPAHSVRGTIRLFTATAMPLTGSFVSSARASRVEASTSVSLLLILIFIICLN